jgi:hypothetical protein
MRYQLGIPSMLLVLITFIFLGSHTACRKLDKTSTEGTLSYSVDTLLFDTVFTARGTSTRSVKIINKENTRLKISSIRLYRGASSPYFINVNGQSGKEVTDINIEANDSIYVFASVNIDPGNVNDPFVVEDKLVASVGNNTYELPILGYGQDAIYITDSMLQTQTWTKDKPYVIIHSAMVDENQTLTIQPGTRIYMHADSRLFVQGTLKINGTKEDSVVFRGDRIDRRIYFDEEDFVNGVGGEWGGLYFTQLSYNNEINYAIFRDGGASTMLGDASILDAAIQVDPDTVNNSIPKLKINNSIVRNSGGYGIFAYNSSIRAENCLVFASAKENVALLNGGTYNFYNCTIAGFAARINTATEKHYSLAVTNYYQVDNSTILANPLTAQFVNCIVYGNVDNEVFFNKIDERPASISVSHCLFKNNEAIPLWVQSQQLLINQNPLFLETNGNNLAINDYRVEEGSPAKSAGISFPGMLALDLGGATRNSPPSIGCYE